MLHGTKHLIRETHINLNIMYFQRNRVLKNFWCRKNHTLIPHPDQCPLGNRSVPLRNYIKGVRCGHSPLESVVYTEPLCTSRLTSEITLIS